MGIGENVGENVGENTGTSGSYENSQQSSYYFQDTFETGDMLSTNEQGFSWGGNNGTGLFNDLGMVWKLSDGYFDPPVTDYDNGSWIWEQDANSDWSAKSGTHFLNVIYSNTKIWCEQRYDLGDWLEEVWFRYWVRIPDNFDMTGGTPSGSTNKWFYVWHDDYSVGGEGSTVGWNLLPGSTDSRYADIDFNTTPGCNMNLGGDNSCGEGVGSPRYVDFITLADRGRWMQVCFRVVQETSSPDDLSTPGSADGIVEAWRKWDGDSSWTTLPAMSDLNLRSTTSAPGWGAGYMFGHWNYSTGEQTEWLVDDMTISNESLL